MKIEEEKKFEGVNMYKSLISLIIKRKQGAVYFLFRMKNKK